LGDPSHFQLGAMGIQLNTPVGAHEAVSCIIPIDDTVLPNTVNFEMRVYDNSSVEGFDCAPMIINEVGNPATTVTPGSKTTTGPNVGAFTLSGSWTATTTTGNVNTNLYAIRCYVPGNGSIIYSAHVH
jgi:hypothetical protein